MKKQGELDKLAASLEELADILEKSNPTGRAAWVATQMYKLAYRLRELARRESPTS